MKNKTAPRFAIINPPLSFGVPLIALGASLMLLGSSTFAATQEPSEPQEASGVLFGQSYHNDVSPPLTDLPANWPPKPSKSEELREANLNPKLPLPLHVDEPDPVVDRGLLGILVPEVMPAPILNFDGIPFPGVA